MVDKNQTKGFNPRYIRNVSLGDFYPWSGYEVTDSLSDRNYLLFSLHPASKSTLCENDLRMRDHLFSDKTGMAHPALSLQESGNGITFLLPHFKPAFIPEALTTLGSSRTVEVLRELSGTILDVMASGLFFNNLTPGSLVLVNGSPMILPVAYLLPCEMIRHEYRVGLDRDICPLFRDLHGLGNIFSLFCEHIDPESSRDCREIAAGLEGLGRSTSPDEYYKLMERMNDFLGKYAKRIPYLTFQNRPAEISPGTIRKLRQKALKIRDGEKHLIIIRGVSGTGKTSFLREASFRLRTDWGLEGYDILSDQAVFTDYDSQQDSVKTDFVLIDDHSRDDLLNGCVVDRLSREMERCSLAVIVTDGDSQEKFIEALSSEGKISRFKVDEIELPVPDMKVSRKTVAALLPPAERETFLKSLSEVKTPSETMIRARIQSLPGRQLEQVDETTASPAADTKKTDKTIQSFHSIFNSMSVEEKSVLDFIATFRFDVPLQILQSIYSTEEKDFYKILQNLVSMGFVVARAENSLISGNKLCLVFGINSRSLAARIRSSIPAARRKDLHRSIARILKENTGTPLAYIYFHLTYGGLDEDAAFKGMEIFHLLLGRKKINAISCFNENFIDMKLETHLPPEMRFKLYLELGDYFSLIGNIDKAEALFRKCREEMNRKNEWQTLRGIATEAIRRECEILEKRGNFKKAEGLLKKTLEKHGEHILSSERARLYNDLAWIYYRIGKLDESWENCLLVQKIIDKKQDQQELAQSFSLMGAINWNRSKYDEALYCHKKCLAIREELGDERGIGATNNNFGLVLRSMGRMKDALDSFLKSMKIKQRINDIPGLAAAHLNLALAYMDLEEIEKAEKNCSMARKLAEDLGNQQLLAEIWGTLGEICFLRQDLESARECYFKDLHICHKTKSMREKAIVFRRLGELGLFEGKLTETKGLLSQARALNAKIGSRLETILLDLLEGRILLAEGKRESGRMKLEGTSFELSLLGRKRTAASVTAEIGELYLDEGNEHLAREYLLRAISLISESDNIPAHVKNLQKHLDQRISRMSGRIDSDSMRFRALCRVVSFIRTIPDSDKLYETVTETARRMMNMERAALILQTGNQDTYRLLAVKGEFESEGILTDKNVIAILTLTRQLGYPLDISRSQIPEGKISDDFQAAHPGIICTPLWISDDVTGFLYLDSSRRSVEASDGDHSFLVAFSQQVTLGLERLFLFEKLNEAERTRMSTPNIVTTKKERITFRDIIGKSPAMRQVYELIENIRDMDTTVLLTGPNGSGKDLIAKAIHDTGPRNDKPFHHLNCAAFPVNLLESELFGHEKGSFTGAMRQNVGHFEKAAGGTIYLNEIGEMPVSLQAKLLRVLEERKFFRVGGTREIKTDARIITATNRNLQQLVREGAFREDLFYRINVFPIRIPALRERREDISLLCNHFLTTFCRVYNIPTKKLSPESMTYINEYEWPGNVRELENTIKRLIIISKKETILPEELPESILTHTETVHAQALTTLEDVVESLLENVEYSVADPVLPKVEKSIVKKVVEMTGDKQKAARLLGVSKPTLYNWLKKYNGDKSN
ncbi:MAG: sigma 54-interacting transcriptional regulator [Bacteroidales bacterium]|nr:sigma 54-interacting transcriptional regulator [Candidatus Latescibacterota bacterium]